MKKLFAALLAILCLTAAHSALAQTQTSWNQSCVLKTIASTTLFSWDEESESLSSAGTVPGGSYIKQGSDDAVCAATGKARITWCSSNGSTRSGYIDPGVIVSATASVKLNNGKKASVPEALLDDPIALDKYLWNTYPKAMQGNVDDTNPVASAAAQANSSVPFSVEYPDDSGEFQVVKVTELGLAWTDITIGSFSDSVPTVELTWTSDMKTDQSLGIIHAPKTGKVSLYSKASDASTVIKKLEAGRIAFVISRGSGFVRIWCNGQIGYVKSAAIKLCGPVEEPVRTSAVLAVKGKTTGRATVNIRSEAGKGGRVILKPKTGTPVSILSEKGSWYEIDVNGYHGFVQNKYIQLLN